MTRPLGLPARGLPFSVQGEEKARLGPYEILEPLGAGGMGEVHRVRDTRLGREVALKVVPSALDVSPDGKQILFDRYRENSDVVLVDLSPR